MEFGSLDDGDDGEHNDISLVEISKIFAMQDAGFFSNKMIDRV